MVSPAGRRLSHPPRPARFSGCRARVHGGPWAPCAGLQARWLGWRASPACISVLVAWRRGLCSAPLTPSNPIAILAGEHPRESCGILTGTPWPIPKVMRVTGATVTCSQHYRAGSRSHSDTETRPDTSGAWVSIRDKGAFHPLWDVMSLAMTGALSGEACLHHGSEVPAAALAEAFLRIKPPTEGARARGPSPLREVCLPADWLFLISEL